MTDLQELISKNPKITPEEFEEAQRLQREMEKLVPGRPSRAQYNLVTPYQRSRKRTKNSVQVRVHLDH